MSKAKGTELIGAQSSKANNRSAAVSDTEQLVNAD
jgi:hypothetical protein